MRQDPTAQFVDPLLEGLNAQQCLAVSAPCENLLILAGAGSGKTRVLVSRILWLLARENIPLSTILALTFTNKAAGEMRQRIAAALGYTPYDLWIGTFHSTAHRLLRMHYQLAKLPQDFQIIDQDDQLRLLKRLIKEMNLDDKKWSARQAMWYIGTQKDRGYYPDEVMASEHPSEQVWQNIYYAYQSVCERGGLVDFNEILLRLYRLLQQDSELCHHYQQRFKHILVDECQDTNFIQYQLIRLLAGNSNYVVMVGDDDQSIYGWRGARVENLHHFLQDFQHVKTIHLEQNYRSNGAILAAANAVIKNNQQRLGKNLWTEQPKGDPIALYAAFNELDEARFVAGQIKQAQETGDSWNDCAVLYRNNAQSRIMEENLLQLGIPYRIYGGTRFFDRQEIRDALAYLRLVLNPHDDAAFERVVNRPTRGVGERTLMLLRQQAQHAELTLWQSALLLLQNRLLTGRSASAIARFLELIQSLQQDTLHLSLEKQTEAVLHYSGLWSMYEQEPGEKGYARIENLQELITAVTQFTESDWQATLTVEEQRTLSPLQQFLSYAALESGETHAQQGEQAVQLMTLHSAKGLEFKRVFIIGVEEGMFPSQRALQERDGLEEERRLAYVGITRAMQQLTLSYAESRRLYGREERHVPSRFIAELPMDCIQEVRLRATITRPFRASLATQTGKEPLHTDGQYAVGSKVQHVIFGQGTIISRAGEGEHLRVQVAFVGEGVKWLMVSHAKLSPLGGV